MRSLVDELLSRVLLAIVHHWCVLSATLEALSWIALAQHTISLISRLLVQCLIINPLLLFLLLLLHVVVHLLLLWVKYFETVFEAHITLELVMFSEKLRVTLFAAKFKWRDIDALQTLLERLEGFWERQKHQDALESLHEILGVLVLTSELDAQVDETWRFNQLNQATKGYKLGSIHLDLSESGDQSVGQLIVPRK